MDWTKWSDYFLESDNFRYRISKASVGQKWLYAAWKCIVRDKKAIWVTLLITEDLRAARAACEKDATE